MSSSASAASTYFLPFSNYISSFHRHIILILCLLHVFLFLAMFYYQNRRYLIDDICHQKSIDETYYILDSFTLWDPHPAFQIIGNTGNLYDVYFGPSTIKCSCPDRKSPCKHIIFLLTLLGVAQNLVISPSTFYIVFSKYTTDVHSNHTCLSVAPTSFACPLFTNTAGYATRASTGMAILMFVTNANSLLMHHILTTGKMQHIPTP